MGREMVMKSVTTRNAKEFDDILNQILLSRKSSGKKAISKVKLTRIIALKLRKKQNLEYETFTKI